LRILVDDANVGALGGEYASDSASNTASPAGDQRYFSAQVAHYIPPPCCIIGSLKPNLVESG
jgi:hypothetical protein